MLQISLSQFGQNILQYERFDWKYIQSTYFDIYFYDNGIDTKDFIEIESTLKDLTEYVTSLNLMTKGGERNQTNPLKNPLIFANCIEKFLPKLEFSQNQKNIPDRDDVKDDKLKKLIRLYTRIKGHMHNISR